MTPAISIKDLKKTYREGKTSQHKEALRGVNLEIPQGSFFGLLGPNGAGKSTIINILAGLTLKTSGKINVLGFDLDENPLALRHKMGIVPQELVLDPFFNVTETLEYYAGYYGIPQGKRH